jgi:hypothetical protein
MAAVALAPLFKRGDGRSARIPAAFTSVYPDARAEVITRANYDLSLLETV